MTSVECGAELATAGVCRECGAPVASGLGSEALGRQPGRREASKVVRVLGVTFVVILNVLALWLAIGFPVAYVTQGSHAQLGADYIPLWATIFVAITCGSVPVITFVAWAVHRRSRARERRATASELPVLAPGWVTICRGRGLFLRADDAGLLVRNFYFGRGSRIRITWGEISHFADGAYTKEGVTSWMLLIVLHTGKTVRVLSSVLGSPGEVVAAVRDAARPHGIPAELAGVPMKKGRPYKRGLYQDPGDQSGVRYWDGRQWSPLLPLDLKPAAAKGDESWSALPMAAGPWTYAAARAAFSMVWFVSFAVASAALLSIGLVTMLWWDRGQHPRHISSVAFWIFGGIAALYALVAWKKRKSFLKLDEAAKRALGSWH